jgi:energy-coupling factor transporter transmembrane protein EcfT
MQVRVLSGAPFRVIYFMLKIILFFLPLSAFCYSVDWNELVWSSPNSNNYSNVSDSGYDMTINVNGGSLLSVSISEEAGLNISTDFSGKNDFVSVSFIFSSPINSLSLGISSFEIGGNFAANQFQYQDSISQISGVGDFTTQVSPANNTIFSGGVLYATGVPTGASYIVWSGSFTEASFRFRVGPDSRNNPIIQSFAISSAIFVIPETNQIFPLIIFFLLALLFFHKKRKNGDVVERYTL